MLDLIVGGREMQGTGVLAVRNPFDGALVAEVARAGASEVALALDLACKHQRQVGCLTRAERATILDKVSDRLLGLKEDLACTLAREVGKTIREARVEVDRAAATFACAAEEAKRIGGEVVPFDAVAAGRGRRGYTIRVPVGTVVAITPFNFPLNLAAHKIAPAIAAGNAFILKPASQTPLTDLKLGRVVLDAGFPPEAMSVLPGPGSSVGMELVSDPRPRMVTFTGSAEVGKKIAARAGLKRTAMELGSNCAVIVTGRADLDFAVKRIVAGGYALAGQVCISVQRVLVEESVFEQVVGAVAEAASQLKAGDQLEEATDMGPMISEEAADRVEAWIEEAAGRGAEVRLKGRRSGAVLGPAVLARVPTDSKVWAEEAFGPLVCINPYRALGEAIAAANQSRYGLQAAIFTDSVEEAHRAIEALDVGGVMVNDMPTYRVDHMPYGGVKDSGIGREGLKYAIEEMTETKVICFNFWRP